MRHDAWSNTIKSTAIYLYKQKGATREYLSAKFGVSLTEIDDWIDEEFEITKKVKQELTGSMLSKYT